MVQFEYPGNEIRNLVLKGMISELRKTHQDLFIKLFFFFAFLLLNMNMVEPSRRALGCETFYTSPSLLALAWQSMIMFQRIFILYTYTNLYLPFLVVIMLELRSI